MRVRVKFETHRIGNFALIALKHVIYFVLRERNVGLKNRTKRFAISVNGIIKTKGTERMV